MIEREKNIYAAAIVSLTESDKWYRMTRGEKIYEILCRLNQYANESTKKRLVRRTSANRG